MDPKKVFLFSRSRTSLHEPSASFIHNDLGPNASATPLLLTAVQGRLVFSICSKGMRTGWEIHDPI